MRREGRNSPPGSVPIPIPFSKETHPVKKLTVLLSMAAVVAALAAGVAGVFDTGSQTVHASRLAGISQAGSTGIQVQNLDPSQSANILAE